METLVIADPKKPAGRAFLFLIEMELEKRISSVEASFLRSAFWPLVERESEEVTLAAPSNSTVN